MVKNITGECMVTVMPTFYIGRVDVVFFIRETRTPQLLEWWVHDLTHDPVQSEIVDISRD